MSYQIKTTYRTSPDGFLVISYKKATQRHLDMQEMCLMLCTKSLVLVYLCLQPANVPSKLEIFYNLQTECKC